MNILETKYSQDFIYLIDNLGRVQKISPSKIRIIGFKNSFTNIDMNAFTISYIQNIRTSNLLIALITGNLVTEINNGSLWNEEEDGDVSFFTIVPYNDISTSALENIFKTICPESSVCIALGQYTKQIYNYFLGFTEFQLVSEPAKVIRSSSNRFVYEISYERQQYKAKSVLKSSHQELSDNLLYEYLVGQYINKQCSFFPCFIQTYGWFKYTSKILWHKMSSHADVTSTELINGICKGEEELKTSKHQPCFVDKERRIEKECTKTETLLGFACTNSKYLSILIEHVEGRTLRWMMKNDRPFLMDDLLYVLYQIYMPLSILWNEFTHYDLHTSNVMVYELDFGKYIEYKYVFKNGDIIYFKSKYIAKIIDYGSSYFFDFLNDDITGSSKRIYDNICNNVGECDFNSIVCGEAYGFGMLGLNSGRNISYDLLLLKEVKQQIWANSSSGILNEDFLNMLKKVPDKTDTVEKLTNRDSGNIENIFNAHNELRKLITDSANKIKNTKNYEKFDSFGSLTIYESRKPMEFVLRAGGQ